MQAPGLVGELLCAGYAPYTRDRASSYKALLPGSDGVCCGDCCGDCFGPGLYTPILYRSRYRKVPTKGFPMGFLDV